MISLSLSPTGSYIVIGLVQYLGSQRFDKFRAIMAENGCSYDRATSKNLAQFSAVPKLIADFKAAGLPVACDAAITSRLIEEADRAKAELETGRARVEACRARLAAKGLRLFRYQETGIEWLAPRKRALLGDEPGLGKTPQALLALPENACALAIVPGVAIYNWADEVKRWRPDLKPVPIKSGAAFRWPRPGEIIISSFGTIPAHERGQAKQANTLMPEIEAGLCLEDYGMPAGDFYCIVDEAHYVKTARATRTKRVRAIAAVAMHCNATVWLLTGTPMKNRELELWNVLETCKLGTDAFGKYPAFVAAIGSRHTPQFAAKLQKVMLRRRKDEVLKDLPPKRRTDTVVELDAKTAAMCDELVAALKSRGKDVDDVLSSMNDPIVFERISAVRAAVATAKIPMMLDLVEEAEEAETPAVVVCAHREPIEVLAGREGWKIITGDTSFEERFKIAQEFQAGKLKGVGGTIAAMGVAINLTFSSYMIMVDLAWTPADNVQVEDRLRRIGQKNSVLIRRLVADHDIDRRVIELLTIKQELIERTIEASAVEEEYLGTSPAEALAKAAASAAEAPQTMAMSTEAMNEMLDRDRKKIEDETRSTAAGASDGRSFEVKMRARGPVNAVEDWAKSGLIAVAAMDPDRAFETNDMGFSKFDNEFGHSLANQLKTSGMLTEKQWASAVKLANRYRRQIGPPPTLTQAE